MSEPVVVTGGTDGAGAADAAGAVRVDADRLRALAGAFGAAATDALAGTVALHGYLLAPLPSALLDPAGCARFEAALFNALDGGGGLGAAGLLCGALDAELRVAAGLYEGVDATVRGLGATAAALPALTTGTLLLLTHGDPGRAGQTVLALDPGLADLVVDGLGLPAALGLLAGRLPDGHGALRHPEADAVGPAGQPPRRLTDVLADLSRRNDDPRPGEIDVRILTLPGGSRRVIVDITGTKSWDPLPTGDVTSLTTNARAIVGERTAYEQGVLAALRAAGVRADDPVLLVGHSEGGLVAVNAARDAVRSGEFRVTHVVTAGAPVGRIAGQLPSSVQLLALENAQDVVPHLDGVDNPARPNVVTASSSHGDGTVLDDHSIGDGYLPVAADVQASDDPALRAFLGSAAGYFQGVRVTTLTFQVVRVP